MPADSVHDVVVEALAEVGLDVNGRTPQHVSDETLAASDFAATMGCSTLELDGVDTDDWDLDDRASARSRRYVRSATRSSAA